ncbi:MAG: Ig-like domain-containing protein [Massilia sp.]
MLPKFLQRSLAVPLRFLVGASLAVGLVACGGGGGNASAPSGGTGGSANVGSISLSASATTIDSSGTDGTEVTLTAIVKDSGNSAMSGVTVGFTADSGTITNTSRISSTNGVVVEKLSVKGDSSLRAIKIHASAGGVNSNEITVTVIAPPSPPKVLLTSSDGNLNSNGTQTVDIRALVINTSNVVVPNAVVTFTSDSGTLSASTATTDANGLAIVKLGTGTDPTTRTITVTATVVGTPPATVAIAVSGTKLLLDVAPTLNVGAVSEVTATLQDRNGLAIPNQTITFTSARNTLVLKAGQSGKTDTSGKVVLVYTITQTGTDTVTLKALGETTSKPVATVSSVFTVTPNNTSQTSPKQAVTGACTQIDVSNFQNGNPVGGNVTFSSSRGLMYIDSGCITPLAGTLRPLTNGVVSAWMKATSPGIATISVTSDVSSSTAQGLLEVVAPLTAGSVIALQATPSVIGVNSAISHAQQSTLRAVVTDSSGQGNPVKGAKVAFSILNDPSGGTLSQPSEIITGDDGSASVSFIAGTTATATDGVTLQAAIVSSVNSKSATAKLTVAQQALTISAGTGNTVGTPNTATFTVDYVVVVADAAGNPVSDVNLTASIKARHYMKGFFQLTSGTPAWSQQVLATCNNEDVDGDGVLGPLEDQNGNLRLDPGIPVTITAKGKTDATGTAIVQVLYPRDRARWIDVDFTISATVAGSEGHYVGYTILPGLAGDYTNASNSPPGVVSPYGQAAGCNNTN